MTSVWVYRLLVLAHLGGFGVFLGAVAYQLLILLPAFAVAGTDRETKYTLIRAIKQRLRRVVGSAIVVLVASGLAMAELGGLLRPDAADPRLVIFHWKLAAVAILILTFLFALRLLQLVKTGSVRGRLFVGVHVMVLIIGGLAALAGIALSR